jgi:hypothetical protein
MVRAAWEGGYGQSGEPPAAWVDNFGNVIVDYARAPDVLHPGAPEGPIQHPGEKVRSSEPEDDGAYEDESAGASLDPAAAVVAGEDRGVSGTIEDPALASRLFLAEQQVGKFVRFINNRRFLEHAWQFEYGGKGAPPPGWFDGAGYLVIDAERVVLAFSPSEIPPSAAR